MNFKKQNSIQTLKEEIVNAITHGIGFFLSFIGLYVLIAYSMKKESFICLLSCSVYGSSLVILYFMSAFYHSCKHIEMKKILQKLDHISIYLLIAGTYTPIALLALKGSLGWSLFFLEMFLCVIGIIFKIFFGARFDIISVLFYLLMGWIAIFVIKPLFLAMPFQGLVWILIGGIFYSLGVFFYATDKKFYYFHAIWHLFVLAGSISHFVVVLLYIMPYA